MNDDSTVKAICPLYNFQISEGLVGDHTREETIEYFNGLRKRLEQGIEILNHVRIRRIRKEDIDRVKQLAFFDLYIGILHRITYRSFIIEVLTKEKAAPEILLKIYKILLALRLYKTDNVFCKVIWYDKKSKVSTITILDPPLPELMGSTYAIMIDEIKEIKKMARKLDRIDFGERNSLRIACERFSRSYEEYRKDEQIIDFMVAFEALFLRGRAQSRIGSYIGLGCSMLLGKNDKERQEIYDFLVKAYEIRNDIVHGSEFITSIQMQVGDKTYGIQEVVVQLREYLRESIKKLI